MGGNHAPLQVELEGLTRPVEFHVAILDVLDDAAAAGLGLVSDGGPVSGIGNAVADFDIADAAGGFPAHGDAATAIGEVRVLDEDILGGTVDAEAVGILAGPGGDAIVLTSM